MIVVGIAKKSEIYTVISTEYRNHNYIGEGTYKRFLASFKMTWFKAESF